MMKWMFAAAAFVLLAGDEATVKGFGPQTAGPQNKGSYHSYGRTLPVYMAAPWYLYWPYDAHFMTPAPVYGAFSAPPMMGNFPVQPYFPVPQYMPPAPVQPVRPAIVLPPG